MKTFDQLSYNSLRPSSFCVHGAAILRETWSCFHSFSGLKTLLVTLKDPGVEVRIKDKYVRRREKFLVWPLVAAAIGDDKKNLRDHCSSYCARLQMPKGWNSCQCSQITEFFTFKGLSFIPVSSSFKHESPPADKVISLSMTTARETKLSFSL